jgi:hypothetical protein
MGSPKKKSRAIRILAALAGVGSFVWIIAYVAAGIKTISPYELNWPLPFLAVLAHVSFYVRNYGEAAANDLAQFMRLLADLLLLTQRFLVKFSRFIRDLFSSNDRDESPKRQINVQDSSLGPIDQSLLRSIQGSVPKSIAITLAILAALFVAVLNTSFVVRIVPQEMPRPPLGDDFASRFWPSECACGGPANDLELDGLGAVVVPGRVPNNDAFPLPRPKPSQLAVPLPRPHPFRKIRP